MRKRRVNELKSAETFENDLWRSDLDSLLHGRHCSLLDGRKREWLRRHFLLWNIILESSQTTESSNIWSWWFFNIWRTHTDIHWSSRNMRNVWSITNTWLKCDFVNIIRMIIQHSHLIFQEIGSALNGSIGTRFHEIALWFINLLLIFLLTQTERSFNTVISQFAIASTLLNTAYCNATVLVIKDGFM